MLPRGNSDPTVAMIASFVGAAPGLRRPWLTTLRSIRGLPEHEPGPMEFRGSLPPTSWLIFRLPVEERDSWSATNGAIHAVPERLPETRL